MRFSEFNSNAHLVETALAANNPKADLEAKRKALQDLERQSGVDQAAVRQRKLELEKEARAKGLATDVAEEKVRLDPACWHNKKIGNPKTKVKGGVRVNNCVPKEDVAEDYSRDWEDDQRVFKRHMLQRELHKTNNSTERQRIKDQLAALQPPERDDDNYSRDELDFFARAQHDPKTGLAIDRTVPGRTTVKLSNRSFKPAPGPVKNPASTGRSLIHPGQAGRTQPRFDSDGGITEQELAEEFDMIERIIECIAAQNDVDADVVWTDLESLTEDELYAFAVTSQLNEDWSKVNKRDKTDGMSKKAVNAYRRENPGSKLQTAVTTKPSKLKKGSKASKRRKSYCSRSRGQMKMHNISCAKTPDKAICKARRRWNC